MIEEVREELGNPNISESIAHFIESDEAAMPDRCDAREMLRFFSALEARALHGYSLDMQNARI